MSIPPRPPRRLVQTLRANGVKVRILHYRYALPIQLERGKPLPTGGKLTNITRLNRAGYVVASNGGETHVSLLFPDGREVGARSICSKEDSYDKRMGVWLAVRRATAAARTQRYRSPLAEALFAHNASWRAEREVGS